MFVKERFRLNQYAKSLISSLEPDFGYDGFGEFIFYRTYSRTTDDGRQETWHDTCIRVIEGCMSIRKDWYLKNHILWEEKFWQEYALKMIVSLFKMEWLAPGRGLWVMGTDFVYERGSMALNNCMAKETRFLTDQGIISFGESVGKTVKILCQDNVWRNAEVKDFGAQRLNLITFNNDNEYYATANHRWIIDGGVVTDNLQSGDKVPRHNNKDLQVESIIESGRFEHVYCLIEPITSTFTLADGIITGNCGFTDIGDDFESDLGWLMDALMLGVGVGFAPFRNDKIEFSARHSGTYDFEIPDSREGWVESCVRLMTALRYGGKRPRQIYDKVRPAGEIIRGFGGVASGPEPLIYLHEKIEELFSLYMDDPYYDSVMLKTDLANLIGCCVVAGNVRRSAELGSLSINDPTFKDLKNYEDPRYSYRSEWGWMSNNSVDLENDKDFELLDEIAERVKTRGEPGYKNLCNFPYGRIGKTVPVRLDKAKGLNPCIVGDTGVYVADGRGFVPIIELVKEGDVDVFCVDENLNEITIRRMRNVRLTGENQKILRVTFDDDTYVRVTEHHKFMLRDGTYLEAKDLKTFDQVARVNRYIPDQVKESYFDQYISIGYKGKMRVEHKFIAVRKFNFIFNEDHIHHIDENKLNNHPDNIDLKDATSHLSDHSIGSENPNWSGYTNKDIIDLGVVLCKKLGRRFSTDEWKVFSPVDIRFSNQYRNQAFSSFPEFASYCAEIAEVINEPYDTRTLRFLQEIVMMGYEADIVDGEVIVTKICEGCKNIFTIKAQRREQAYCSLTCNNTYGRDYKKNVAGQKVYFEERRKDIRQQQADVATLLKAKTGFWPTQREWKAECQNQGISSEIHRSGAPFQTMGQLIYYASQHNHRVLSVTLDGYEDVYNGTVDDFHNMIIGGWSRSTGFGRRVHSGVVTAQCGESLLESKELCCQAETLPTRCDDANSWLKACEYATVYASTVSLLPTHQPETNTVIARNRRITVGIIDYTGWKLAEGVNKVTKYMREGYDVVTKSNQWVNGQAGVPEGIRKTTIKPGGTTPKLAGRTPGIGHPTFKHTLRRVIVAKNSPIVSMLIEAGVPYEDNIRDAYSYVFEWPIIQGPAEPAYKVSLWEQAMNLVLIQREWADNAVSNTLYFKPKWVLIKIVGTMGELREYLSDKVTDLYQTLAKLSSEDDLEIDGKYKIKTSWDEDLGEMVEGKIFLYDASHEEDSIEPVLSAIAPLTKSVSLLPHSPKGVYAQMPEEGISEEEYLLRKNKLKKIDWSKLKNSAGEDERYCQGDTCLPI